MSAAVAALWSAAIFLRLHNRLSLHDSFVLGIPLVFLFVATLPGRPRLQLPSPGSALAAVGLLVLGTLTRTLAIDQFPPPHGQLWEEAQLGKIAAASIRDDALDHYFPLPNLLAEIGMRLGGPSLPALRVPFVVASAAAVPVFLLAARALGVAAFAAFGATALFACSAYLAVAGRVALESHSGILTLCAALAACFHALRAPSPFAFALAGACSGLLMTEYTSYRLYPPLLFAMLAVAAYRDRGAGAACAAAVLFLGCAVAVMLPVLAVPNENPLHMLAEGVLRHGGDMAAAGGSSLAWTHGLAARIGRSASFVFLQGSANDLLPASTGVVDLFTGIVAVGALAYCAARARRDAAAAFLVVAVVATVVLAGALTQSPARYRISPLPPLLFLAIALAFDAARRRWRSTAAGVALGLGVAALCAVNLHLLSSAMAHPRVLAELGDRRLAVALEIARLQARSDAVVVLATAETYMGEPNDFSFLYDLDRVRPVEMLDDVPAIAETPGILLVDEENGDAARRLAGAADCRTDEYRYGPERRIAFVACAIGTADERR